MTLFEFNSILTHLGKKTAWNIQLAALPLGGKLDDKLHPLTPSIPPRPKKQAGGKKQDTSSIVNKINKFGVGR